MSRAILDGHATGAGLLNRGELIEYTIEAEVLETAGSMSKIRILDISGVDKYTQKQIRESFPKWVDTKHLTFLKESNSSQPATPEEGKS